MDEKEKYKIIEKYLQGEFSEEEKKAIEQKIAEDPELWAEANLQNSLHRFLQNQDEIKLRDQLKEIEQAGKRKNIPYFTYGIAAAISLIILFSLFFWYDQSQLATEEIFAVNFEPYPMVLNQRNAEEANQTIKLAINAYLDQDYQQSIAFFDQLINQDTLVTLATFYQGVSYLALQQPEQSLAKLKQVKETGGDLWQQQASWYMGLAYLLMEEQEQAIDIFKELAENENYKQEAIEKIIRQLKE